MRGLSQTWMVSRLDAGTAPTALACAMNGAVLPASGTVAGRGAATAAPAPAIVSPATAAMALSAPMNALFPDIVQLSPAETNGEPVSAPRRFYTRSTRNE